MINPEIEKAILSKLHNAYFGKENPPNIETIRLDGGWDKVEFDNEVDRLVQTHMITIYALGGIYELTTMGVLRAEKKGFVQDELNTRNQSIRERAMNKLADLYEKSGSMAYITTQEIAPDENNDTSYLVKNLFLLSDLLLIDWVANSAVRITQKGLSVVEKCRKNKGLEDKFNEISKLESHARGRAFQKWLAKYIGEQMGWTPEEGVKTSNEEMDVILSQKREYYLLEAKWEKDPIEAPVIRELIGKLDLRADVRGIVVSMSGFTGGAVERVEQHSGQRVILLFGKEDINRLVKGDITFEDLLNEKYRELVTRRKVVYG